MTARPGSGAGEPPSEPTLLVGTRRGLFRGERSPDGWTLSEPMLVGREVFHAFLDPRDGRTAWAASRHEVWGAHIHRSDDGGRSWTVLEAAPAYPDERGLDAIWFLAPGPPDEPDTLWAGIQPAGLFVSRDRGESWRPVSSLNDHPTNESWQPAGGGLALGNIQHDPEEPRRLYCSLSAGGCYRSDDGGESWRPINRGVRADFLPDPAPETGQCVHKLLVHPLRPERLYQQNHCGTYRSDDRGEQWVEITHGLPSDYGYALALDPHDPDTLFVVPEESSHMRATVGGKLRVYRSTDAGRSWRPLIRGLPQHHAYVSVLRDAMVTDDRNPCAVYVGTSTGHLFVGEYRGEQFRVAAGFLPKILSVTVGASGS